jgi:hypothetical protein
MTTLVERLRDEARLIQYGERACVPGLLHEAADMITAQQRTIELQGNEVRSLEADARRYRWLRSAGLQYVHVARLTPDTCDIGLDTAIDAALSAQRGGE